VDELLPPQAWQLEMLRRCVLDVFVSWGFDYVEPPVIEYLDSLLVGSGGDLDLQTLQVVDQTSGLQLGIRADMTSQAVRIDAHSRKREGVQRLCYAGPVVFANPEIAQTSRVPFKAGAEIFGAQGLNADSEVVCLMLEVLHTAGIDAPVLLLGHMGIYNGLVDALLESGDLDSQDEAALFKCVQRKAQSDVRELLRKSDLSDMMVALPMLMGADLAEAGKCLEGAPETVINALADLQELAGLLQVEGVEIRFDVAELSGYGYHNGPVFAVYHPQHGSALAQGGRYDGIGEVFGRARPATGFDVNLKQLLGVPDSAQPLIFAPLVNGSAAQMESLAETIRTLRAEGHRVRCGLTYDEVMPDECTSLLVQDNGTWQMVARPHD
jgi:ATP phosphoribosyltransferase regulatory subunit